MSKENAATNPEKLTVDEKVDKLEATMQTMAATLQIISLTLSTLTTSSVSSIASLIPTIAVPPVPTITPSNRAKDPMVTQLQFPPIYENQPLVGESSSHAPQISSLPFKALYPPFEMNNPTLPTTTPLTLNVPTFDGTSANYSTQFLGCNVKACFRRWKMAPYANDEKVLIHYFQDSLSSSANVWFSTLDKKKIQTFKDVSQAFMKQYEYNMSLALTRDSLQRITKKGVVTISQDRKLKIYFEELVEVGLIKTLQVNPIQPPYPYWYDAQARCEYHNVASHGTENCAALKHRIQDLIDEGTLQLDVKEAKGVPNITQNPLPPHDAGTMNMITFNGVEKLMLEDTGSCGRCYVSPKVEESRKATLNSKDIKIEEMLEKSPKKLVLENEVAEFLNILRKSEYSIIEQLNKTLAKISILELMLSSEVHLDALLKVLREAHVPKNIDTQKFGIVVGAILAPNFINFTDDEIPDEGNGHTKALHISVQCKMMNVPHVLINNGLALNVIPMTVLKQLKVDESHINHYNTMVRAFDRTKMNVVGKIELLVEIGPVTFDVDFFVIDISPAFNMLLGRPWIHVVRAVPSTLHQKVKYIVNGVLVTVNGEEEHIIRKATTIPYLGINLGTYESSYHSMECVAVSYIHPKFRGKWAKMAKPTRVAAKIMTNWERPKKEDWQRMCAIKAEKHLTRLQGRDPRDEPMWVLHIRVTFPRPIEILCPSLDGYVVKRMDVLYVDPEGTIFTDRLLKLGECSKQAKFEEVVVEDITDEVCFDDEENSFGFNNLFGPAKMTDPKERWRRILVERAFMEKHPNFHLVHHVKALVGSYESVKEESLCDLWGNLTINALNEEQLEFDRAISPDMPRLDPDIAVHAILLYYEAKSVKQKLRRMKPEVLLKVKEEVQKLLDINFIEVVLDLNKASPKDDFPLPHIQILLDSVAKNAWFSFVDGYSGATYQHFVITLLHDFVHTIVEPYVDDMVIMSKEEVLHTENLKKVFERLRKCQLRLNPTKCTFDVDSGKLLGFIVSHRGIEIDPAKIKAIDEMLPPKTQKKVRGFLGRINYIAYFIANLTTICKKERAIYYVSKKFNDCESKYSPLEKTCCALAWTSKKLRHYMLTNTTYLLSRMDPIKFIFEKPTLSGRISRWRMLLSKFDIVYTTQKAIKGQAIADHLVEHVTEDYEPIDWDFLDEDILVVEAKSDSDNRKLFFDGADNQLGCGLGAVLVSPKGDHFPITIKLDFSCTNSIAEYEACIAGIHAALDMNVRDLEIYGDWQTKDPKLIPYHQYLETFIKKFRFISLNHMPHVENQFADALATLASMIQISNDVAIKPLRIEISRESAHCMEIKVDDKPWFHDIKQFLQNGEYPLHASEVHEGICGTHANGRMLARKFLQAGYYWLTMEHDCIKYARACHKCQIYADHINAPPLLLHNMSAPWPFSMWGIDVIGEINPKASNGHQFILVAIDYFTKWVEAASYASVTKKVVTCFIKREIICRYRQLEAIITNNASNLNNDMITVLCKQFKIKHLNSSPYQPKMNGAVEVPNKNIKKILAKMIVTYKDWHEMLPYALHAYRTSIRTSTGATPYSLVYGMEVVLPIELEIPSMRSLSKSRIEEEDLIQKRIDHLNLLDEKR
ncbi:hypothetical protein SLEP1_g22551 [Rubroshorea leprosula]|uniref:RNA-directed DNA polymerase n=1 Tax=Rubroshorea leprosula TaxID=152421 RepID=A0AAV5JEW9_9ROSI|nr:hypothetical protein SLEP1_g22551 [Rubroshorea leprosula]